MGSQIPPWSMALCFTCLVESNLDPPLPTPFQTVFLLHLSCFWHFFWVPRSPCHAPDRNSTNVTQKSTSLLGNPQTPPQERWRVFGPRWEHPSHCPSDSVVIVCKWKFFLYSAPHLYPKQHPITTKGCQLQASGPAFWWVTTLPLPGAHLEAPYHLRSGSFDSCSGNSVP